MKMKYKRISQEVRHLRFLTASQLIAFQFCSLQLIPVTDELRESRSLFFFLELTMTMVQVGALTDQ